MGSEESDSEHSVREHDGTSKGNYILTYAQQQPPSLSYTTRISEETPKVVSPSAVSTDSEESDSEHSVREHDGTSKGNYILTYTQQQRAIATMLAPKVLRKSSMERVGTLSSRLA